MAPSLTTRKYRFDKIYIIYIPSSYAKIWGGGRIPTTGIFPKWVNSNGHRRKKKEENTQGTRVGLSSMTERWPLKARKSFFVKKYKFEEKKIIYLFLYSF